MTTPKPPRRTTAIIVLLLSVAVYAQCPCGSDDEPTTQPATQPAGR